MRVKDGDSYVLIGSRGAAPKNPEWVYNLRSDGNVEIREEAGLYTMRVREVDNADERARFWGPGSGGVSTLRRVSSQDNAADSCVRSRAGLIKHAPSN